MQVMLMRLMSKGEYLIVPKGTKFTGLGKLGLNYEPNIHNFTCLHSKCHSIQDVQVCTFYTLKFYA